MLSTPPAFVLSQDQTLHENLSKTTSNSRHLQHNLSQRDKNLTKQKLATPTPQGRCHKNKNHPYPKTLGHTMPNKWHQTIHQHTIEFSKNTHPLIRPLLRGVHLRADVQKCCSRLRGNSSSLPDAVRGSQLSVVIRSGVSGSPRCQTWRMKRPGRFLGAVSAEPGFPSPWPLLGRPGRRRGALTRRKLRTFAAISKSPGQELGSAASSQVRDVRPAAMTAHYPA